uniref:Serine/threonine-protein kinase ULK3 n=1 Tax=Timema cristinae TaxID=61476 RepID=A0A7R9H6I9_TIMCR|nr:unnamed protein product [Timema cristinae]
MSVPHVEGYTIVGKIGFGTYATVYKAFRKVGPREVVAIKCVEKSKLSGTAVNNIITEIKLLKLLKHKHIVEMKDFQWDDKYIYIIMEYCNGGDLSCFIRKRNKLPEAVCRKFLQQLAMALKFLRSHNVCHMDLKPQNLLLMTTPALVLKLGDFGFAQYLSPDTYHNSLRGSPLYMAPEILLKHKYDCRVDLWSVGVIMFECLFGRAPYSSDSFQELAEKIKSQAEIEIPHGSSISEECQDMLVRLLQHDPSKRIDYEEFFKHPFLDLEHCPSSESYTKAVELVKQAVKNDAEGKLADAFTQYCEALRYFVPLISEEVDAVKKTALRARVNDYTRRAEELKSLLYGDSVSKSKVDNQATSTPKLASGLEIGSVAEQYMAEGQYKAALEKFQGSLGVLVPLLSSEPKGRRRDLLHQQIQLWLVQAENTKSLLSLTDMNGANIAEGKEFKSIVCVLFELLHYVIMILAQENNGIFVYDYSNGFHYCIQQEIYGLFT